MKFLINILTAPFRALSRWRYTGFEMKVASAYDTGHEWAKGAIKKGIAISTIQNLLDKHGPTEEPLDTHNLNYADFYRGATDAIQEAKT